MGQDLRTNNGSPAQQATLHHLSLLDTQTNPAFERLASLAARVLHTPIALISLIDQDLQYFKSAIGLPEPWSTQRETPLLRSLCSLVVESGGPLIITDAREHLPFASSMAVPDIGFVAYAGVPLLAIDRQPLGALCVIDVLPRQWTEAEIDILRDLAASVNSEIKLLVDGFERKQAELALAEREMMLRSIGDNLPNGMIFQVIQTAADQISFTYVSEGAARAAHATPAQIYADPKLILDQIIEEDQERYWAAEAESFRNLSVFDIEVRMRLPSGAIEWRHIRSQPRYLSDGRLAWDGFSIDITERKRAEEALRESEERARRLSEVAFEGIAIHDQGVILDANQALADILGYEHTEIIGMPILNFAVPESRALITTNIQRGASQPYEVVGLRKDGSRTIVEIQGKPLSYHGQSVRVTAIRDISARQQAEAALRASEERFRTLIHDLHVGVLLQGPQSEILLSNQAALDLLGLTMDQLLGTTSFAPDWNVVHEDGTPFPGPNHPVPQAIVTRRPVRDVVMGVYRPITRDRVWLLVNAEPQLAEDGSVRQVICSFSNITEQKQTEAALRESEDRYRTFFKHSIDAILLTAPDGCIFAANPAACQIFGRSEEEICRVGRNGLIDPTDARLASALEQRARTGSFKGELTFLRQDGSQFPGEISTALFQDRDGLIKTSMIIRDVTERKRAEEALRKSQSLLQGIVDHAPLSIVIQDITEGRYLLVNRPLEVVTGLKVEQLIGKTIAELYPPEDVALWRAQDHNIASTHQSIQVEDDIRYSDGKLHTSLGIKFPLYDTSGDVYAIGGIFTDITERKRAEQEREQLIDALQEALTNIKTLRGLLPICASCKKIRDDSGYWSQIEAYVQAHSDAVFSHGICPDCVQQLYGDFLEE